MAPTAKIHKRDMAAMAQALLAKRLGVPADQLSNFVKGLYVAQPKQLEFHAACRLCDLEDGPDQIGFGGARGPGKSHALFAQVALDDCQRYEGLKVLYLRKVAKNAKEQFEDLRRSVLKNVKHDWKSQAGKILFPNDSMILIGHFKNESDVDQYLGLEYDIIVIEEATTLTLSKYKTLRDSNRTSKTNFRPRIYLSTNPGGTGHAWFKTRFIVPAREEAAGREKQTETRFIFATVTDNVFIDKGYTKKLEDNTGWKLQAYRYGDWDIMAGQFFTAFRYDVHVKDGLKVIPGAPVWCSFDFGYNHLTTCYLLMRHDGITYVLDEYAERKQLPASNAEGIKGMLKRHGLTVESLRCFPAGSDVFAQRGNDSGLTVADQYAQHGIYFSRANMDRIAGANQLQTMLGDQNRTDAKGDKLPPIEPTIFFSNRCTRLIECIPTLEHDPKRPEDVKKVDMDEEGNGGDDPYDGLRYGVMEYAGEIMWF